MYQYSLISNVLEKIVGYINCDPYPTLFQTLPLFSPAVHVHRPSVVRTDLDSNRSYASLHVAYSPTQHSLEQEAGLNNLIVGT